MVVQCELSLWNIYRHRKLHCSIYRPSLRNKERVFTTFIYFLCLLACTFSMTLLIDLYGYQSIICNINYRDPQSKQRQMVFRNEKIPHWQSMFHTSFLLWFENITRTNLNRGNIMKWFNGRFKYHGWQSLPALNISAKEYWFYHIKRLWSSHMHLHHCLRALLPYAKTLITKMGIWKAPLIADRLNIRYVQTLLKH